MHQTNIVMNLCYLFVWFDVLSMFRFLLFFSRCQRCLFGFQHRFDATNCTNPISNTERFFLVSCFFFLSQHELKQKALHTREVTPFICKKCCWWTKHWCILRCSCCCFFGIVFKLLVHRNCNCLLNVTILMKISNKTNKQQDPLVICCADACAVFALWIFPVLLPIPWFLMSTSVDYAVSAGYLVTLLIFVCRCALFHFFFIHL